MQDVGVAPPLSQGSIHGRLGGNGALQVRSGRVDLDIVARGDDQFRLHTPEAEASIPAREITVVGATKGGAK